MMDKTGSFDDLLSTMGPGAIESMLWQAIQMCWITLPSDKRSTEGLETEFRFRVDRALQNLRDNENRRLGK